MENNTLKVGDKVIWRGCWGSAEPKEAIVTDITKTQNYREKHGQNVQECNWTDYFIVDLNNGHWAYNFQLTPFS